MPRLSAWGPAATLVLAVVAAVARPVLAEGAAEPEDPEREAPPAFDVLYATGNWGGLRSALFDFGIEPAASYTAGSWSNLGGGRDTGTRYEGFAFWRVDFDIEKLSRGAWPGAALRVSAQSYHGGKPTEALVGTTFAQATTNWEAEDHVRVYHLFLEQRLFADRLRVQAGQIAADDHFLFSDYGQLFVNGIFGDNTSFAQSPNAPVYPVAAPGVYAELRVTEAWLARVGVYTGDVGEDETDNHGFEWSLGGSEGVSVFAEIEARASPFGLPSKWKLGAFRNTGEKTEFKSGSTTDGEHAFYTLLDQALLVDARGTTRLAAYFRAQWGPKDDRNVIKWIFDGGINVFEPLPGRRYDAFGVAFSRVDFGSDYQDSRRRDGDDVTGSSWVVEVTYSIAVTPWLVLQPDFQYFLDPHESRTDAVVVGGRAIVQF